MKKVFLLVSICMLFSMNIQAQHDVKGVVLDHDTIFLPLYQDTVLVATVNPYNASNKTVRWYFPVTGQTVIDTLFTLQDTICRVTGLEVGTATIVVEAEDNYRDTCVIHVINPITSMSLSDDTIRMYLDSDTILIASILPFDASDKSMQWTTDDPSIASFEIEDDTICLLTSLKIGEAYIYAVTTDGEFKDSCVIEVRSKPIENLTLSEDTLHLFLGSDTLLIAHLEPTSGIDKSVRWKSVNPDTVELLSSGRDTLYRIRAKAIGETQIIATSTFDDTFSDTCVVIVHGIPAERISLNFDTLTMNITTDTLLISTFFPFNTSDKSVEWTSTDSSTIDIVSTINDTICVISALKSGMAKIAAKSLDGDFTDTCVVYAVIPVDSIVMSMDSITLDINEVYELKAIIFPDSAMNQSILWTISDHSIVDTLFTENDSIAFIKAYKAGISYVYATTSDGGFIDSCVVTVNILPLDSIKISIDSLNLFADSVYQLKTTLFPLEASYLSVVWTSSDSSNVDILSVANDTICTIKAKKLLSEAKIYVTVTTQDTVCIDSCVVSVVPLPITKISMSKDSLTAYLDNAFNTFTYKLEVIPEPDQPPYVPYFEWRSSDPDVVKITSLTVDSICELKPLKEGIAIIYAKIGSIEDSCIITVKEQFLVAETDTTALITLDQSGRIELSLIIPENSLVEATFKLHLPEYFGLTKEGSKFKSALADGFKDNYNLSISRVNDTIYSFNIKQKADPIASMNTVSLVKFLNIYYTIYADALFGIQKNYTAMLRDIVITLNDETILEEDRIEVVIKPYRELTGNDLIGKPANAAYFYNNNLIVNSDKAEMITVYSLNGSLLFAEKKKDGQTVFNLKLLEKVVIVQGSSGWTNKVVNQ